MGRLLFKQPQAGLETWMSGFLTQLLLGPGLSDLPYLYAPSGPGLASVILLLPPSLLKLGV